GVELSLSVKPGDGSMPFQLGSYADDKGNAGLGGSSWFYWTVSSGENDPDLKNKNGHGDINVQLQPVPLPAGSLLLITALGACAIARRRKA
ncbi:MAG: VPLPA-CTERM sorting domain-containing protein, partial [Pseudomonadota bacterium]